MDIRFTNDHWSHYGYGFCNIHFARPDEVIGINTKSIKGADFEVFIVCDKSPSIKIRRPDNWQWMEDEELLLYVINELDRRKYDIDRVKGAFQRMLDDKLDMLSQERTL